MIVCGIPAPVHPAVVKKYVNQRLCPPMVLCLPTFEQYSTFTPLGDTFHRTTSCASNLVEMISRFITDLLKHVYMTRPILVGGTSFEQSTPLVLSTDTQAWPQPKLYVEWHVASLWSFSLTSMTKASFTWSFHTITTRCTIFDAGCPTPM